MARWLHTLDVSDIWRDFDSLGFAKARDEIVKRVKATDFYDEEDIVITDIVEDLAAAEDLHSFDFEWNSFYAFADANRVWVKTF
jgi:hypothetical protein